MTIVLCHSALKGRRRARAARSGRAGVALHMAVLEVGPHVSAWRRHVDPMCLHGARVLPTACRSIPR